MVIKAAIVDDEPMAAALLKQNLNRLSEELQQNAEEKVEFELFIFKSGVDFLTNYVPKYYVVFMDVKMSDMDGMVVAKKLREVDKNVMLIFVTNMADQAVNGYLVDAFDFLVKPVIYEHLKQVWINRMQPALRFRRNDPFLVVNADLGLQRINIREIRYIEVVNHFLKFYMGDKVIIAYGALKKMAEKLKPYGFTSCNRCYLVNMNYIDSVEKNIVRVGKDELMISRPKKKEFLQELLLFMGDFIV